MRVSVNLRGEGFTFQGEVHKALEYATDHRYGLTDTFIFTTTTTTTTTTSTTTTSFASTKLLLHGIGLQSNVLVCLQQIRHMGHGLLITGVIQF